MEIQSPGAIFLRFHHLKYMYGVDSQRERLAIRNSNPIIYLEDLHRSPEIGKLQLAGVIDNETEGMLRYLEGESRSDYSFMDPETAQQYVGVNGNQADASKAAVLPLYLRFFLGDPETAVILSRDVDDLCKACVLKNAAGVGDHCLQFNPRGLGVDYLTYKSIQTLREGDADLAKAIALISKDKNTPKFRAPLEVFRNLDFTRNFRSTYRAAEIMADSPDAKQINFRGPNIPTKRFKLPFFG